MQVKLFKIGGEKHQVAPRLSGEGLSVKVRTFGTSMEYRMDPINVSLSGFLVRRELTTRLPFALNTLVEIEIDLPGNNEAKLRCLGKVVRKAKEVEKNDGQSLAAFGIQIIQTDLKFLTSWSSFLKGHVSEKRAQGRKDSSPQVA